MVACWKLKPGLKRDVEITALLCSQEISFLLTVPHLSFHKNTPTPTHAKVVYYSFYARRKHLVIKDNSSPTWINAVRTCLSLKGLKGMEDINGHDFSSKLFLKYVPARLIAEGANVCQHIPFLKAAYMPCWIWRWILAFHLKQHLIK